MYEMMDKLIKNLGIPKMPPLKSPIKPGHKNRINFVALGDVGGMVLLGLKIMGGDVIDSIGVYDLDKKNAERYEREINQIEYPFDLVKLPNVEIIEEEELFNCDLMVFCATKGVPTVGENRDVRMLQFEENKKIIEYYGNLAKARKYGGMVAVVSDPVDPLCKALLLSSGMMPWQIQGFGLGVMNSRAIYFSKKNKRYSMYEIEGRAFGPHGNGLVIANSIEHYDDEISIELTKITASANLEVRGLGYKPYIAPAISSGSISIILALRGEWHYSSIYVGTGTKGAFLGVKNKMSTTLIELEKLDINETLYSRIEKAYIDLCKII